jgi:hypothetical protein
MDREVFSYLHYSTSSTGSNKSTRKVSVKRLANSSTALFPFGDFTYFYVSLTVTRLTLNITKPIRAVFNCIIGQLLSDSNITLLTSSKNAYFVFTQTILRF